MSLMEFEVDASVPTHVMSRSSRVVHPVDLTSTDNLIPIYPPQLQHHSSHPTTTTETIPP